MATKSIVIGGKGFIGQSVVQELVKRGDAVIAVDRSSGLRAESAGGPGSVVYVSANIIDQGSLAPHFGGADEVYHLAGQLGTSELDADIRNAVHTNVLGALNVFEAAINRGVPRVFFAAKPSVWLNTYTITKHCAEQFARLMTRYNPVQISILRYLNIFGPGQKLVPVRKMLPVFAAQAMRKLPIEVYGDGEQTVDMIFSRDAAHITVDYLRSSYCEKPVDCGTGTEMTVLSIAEAVNAYFGNKAGVRHLTMRKGETPRTRLVANTEALQSILGPLSFTPWQQGLAEALKWYARCPAHEIDAALAFYGIHQKYDVSWT